MEPFVAYLLVGTVLVLIGIIGIRKGSQKKNRCTASASAMIVEIEIDDDEAARENTNKKYSYTPIYEFTVNGTTVRKNGGIYSHNKRGYRVGDSAMVKYNPDDPEEFVVAGENAGKAFDIVLLLFGLVIIAIAFMQR